MHTYIYISFRDMSVCQGSWSGMQIDPFWPTAGDTIYKKLAICLFTICFCGHLHKMLNESEFIEKLNSGISPLLGFSFPSSTCRPEQLFLHVYAKGQLISKPIYDLLTSPKKQTDKFDLFAFLLFTTNKSNSSVHFFGESTARQSAFWN